MSHSTNQLVSDGSFPLCLLDIKSHVSTDYSKAQRYLPPASSSSTRSITSPCPSSNQEGKSATTDFGSTSVVYGFSKERISSWRRFETRLDSLAHDNKASNFRGELEELPDRGPEKGPETSDSAIEDEEDDDLWVDVEDQLEQLFQCVDSKPNLSSRPSLLTNMLHETDRAKSLQNATSRSTPAIRRSRTSDNGPESMPLVLSSEMSRRKMLAKELAGSLCKHMQWERQRRKPASKVLNRQFCGENNLTDFVHKPHLNSSNSLRCTDNLGFYDSGILEYFEKGW
jgi:hypothetical protein